MPRHRPSGEIHRPDMRTSKRFIVVPRTHSSHQYVAHDPEEHVASRHESEPAEHLLFCDALMKLEGFPQSLGKTFIECHPTPFPSSISATCYAAARLNAQ